jgi:hypothetical protein
MLGGIGSKIAGGKFEDGATTGAFGYLFNHAITHGGTWLSQAAAGASTAGGNLLGRLFGPLTLSMMPSSLGDGTLPSIDKLLKPTEGQIVYRVWGGDAREMGQSWTPVDPNFAGDAYRDKAGLPTVNDGSNLSIALVVDPKGIILRPAISLGSTQGGWPEFRIPNPQSQLRIINHKTVSPSF